MSNSSSSQTKSELQYLTGVVERITFHAEDSGYTVARLQVPRFQDQVTIVGNFANIQPGQTLQLQGSWKEHPQYGSQFQVVFFKETKPATITGIEKYLGSGLIKGVGPVTAKRIVAHFGLDTLDILEEQIDRLIEVDGIGRKKVKTISEAWVQQRTIKEVMVFLQGHGVSTVYAVKIYKQYGNSAIAIVKDNPYQLADDIYGIGFLTADKIARNVGISPWSKYRYGSGVLHTLTRAAEDGHCYLPEKELIQQSVGLLTFEGHEAEEGTVEGIIGSMVKEQKLFIEGAEEGTSLCFNPVFYRTEVHLAKLIRQHLSTPLSVDNARVNNWLDRYTDSRGIQLSPQQRQAVELIASSRIAILTGGPGTGKTMTTKVVTALWKAMGKTIALAAPTGRAAKRMTEVTGMQAKTIHRLLEFEPTTMGFKRNIDNPLPQDAIVIDETSMLDLFLAHSLIKAVKPGSQLLLVGDMDQLPSVGPGKVLKDLIDSGIIPTIKLTQVFRQAAHSAIITAAHGINRGEYPRMEPLSQTPRTDCLWFDGGKEPERGIEALSTVLLNYLPKWGFQPATDVQILSPMTRGSVGTRNLNTVVQKLLNPPGENKAELKRGDMIYRVGDRVIQLKNDYDREVFNGDLGIIESIDPIEQELLIRVDDRSVVYDYADLNELGLAWAISIHKSQGSEYPVVIMPMYMQHFMMLNKNLLYTGLTRARKLAILIGDTRAVALAVNRKEEMERYTLLNQRLLRKSPAL
ncbi:MAG: ATP-dependent RecD-like DNA helicase [Chroococcopsis gigantea SAG 12.99]|jgi:exodeoxyribonuclease V alpha subunit|nr:ATP-dependent RecD-like DNA helicase [Chroococcopsis gigantea SAG 12.99]